MRPSASRPSQRPPWLRFLRAIDYYGLVEMEYKWDRRDGQYKLLDVNGRTWGYHTLGQAAATGCEVAEDGLTVEI